MNKKLLIFGTILVIALFIISSCENYPIGSRRKEGNIPGYSILSREKVGSRQVQYCENDPKNLNPYYSSYYRVYLQQPPWYYYTSSCESATLLNYGSCDNHNFRANQLYMADIILTKVRCTYGCNVVKNCVTDNGQSFDCAVCKSSSNN